MPPDILHNKVKTTYIKRITAKEDAKNVTWQGSSLWKGAAVTVVSHHGERYDP